MPKKLADIITKLTKYHGMVNIAEALDDKTIDEMALASCEGYEIDKNSREQWLSGMQENLKLAMQVWEQKNYPHENAANIKYPLLSSAAIQFSSRALPSIVKGKDVVKCRVIGEDPYGAKAAKGQRISTHMSWQCTDEMPEWEPDMDRGLTVLPILGTFFKKTYYDDLLRRNASIFRSPEFVLINYYAQSLESAPRVTDIFTLYPNEIESRKRRGTYVDEDYGSATTKLREEDDLSSRDEDKPHVFIEQHRWWDLDDDGYQEPYIVTIHLDSQKIVRIKARYDLENIQHDTSRIIRIEPVQFFTQYSFMPAADGNIYQFGFGSLLGPINRTINATTNQLLDSGTLANAQVGFIGKGVNLGRGRGGGPIRMRMNEWTPVPFTGDDLRKNFFPAPFKEPSRTLFMLLEFMKDAGEKMSVTELLTGEQSVHNEPATTSLMRVEQGLKVFSSIHKRVYRSLTSEFKKLWRLNRIYGDEEKYYRVLDTPMRVFRQDYDDTTIDVLPVSDESEITDTQRMAKARFLSEMSGRGLNEGEINKRLLEAANIPDIEDLLNAPAQPPDPKIVIEAEKLALERDKFEFDMMKFGYEMAEIQSKIIKNLADAESKEVGPQLEIYKQHMQVLMQAFQARQQNAASNTGNVRSMATASRNSRSNAGSAGSTAANSAKAGTSLAAG